MLEVGYSCLHVFYSGTVCRLPQPGNRSLSVPIDCNDPACGPDRPCKIQRCKTRPAAQIHQNVAQAEAGPVQQPLVFGPPDPVLDSEAPQLFVFITKRVPVSIYSCHERPTLPERNHSTIEKECWGDWGRSTRKTS